MSCKRVNIVIVVQQISKLGKIVKHDTLFRRKALTPLCQNLLLLRIY